MNKSPNENSQSFQQFWIATRPYLLLTILTVVLIWPLLVHNDVPCSHDGIVYYYAGASTRHNLEAGILYSRWLANAALGYGVPFYNIFEPLSRYIVALLNLIGIPLANALNWTTALAIVLTGWGTFRFSFNVFDDEAGGIVAGLASASGAFLLNNVYIRGALAETIALALIPWIFAGLWKTLKTNSFKPIITTASLYAALILSHNITTLFVTPALGVYVLLCGWLSAKNQPEKSKLLPVYLKSLARPLLAFCGGLGLSAFFFIPAFLEKNLVQAFTLTSTRNNSYQYNFANLKEVFALPSAYNPAWLNPTMTIELGAFLTVCALLGLCLGWLTFKDKKTRYHIIFLAMLASIYLFLSFSISALVYEASSLLQFVQFPWRMVGRTAFPAAVLAGLLISTLRQGTQKRPWITSLSTTGLSLLFLISGMPRTYPGLWCPVAPFPTTHDVYVFETSSGMLGIHNEGATLPVDAFRPTTSPLKAAYEQGQDPQRFDLESVPVNAAIDAQYFPLKTVLYVDTPVSFTARYLSFYYPGWKVTINRAITEIHPESETGLITFDIPAGTSEVIIAFGLTPLRLVATIISSITALLLVSYPLAKEHVHWFKIEPMQTANALPKTQNAVPHWLFVGIGVALLLARLYWPQHLPAPWYASRSPLPANQMNVVHANSVKLLGYDLPSDEVNPEEEFNIITYWSRIAEMPEDQDTQVTLHVTDENGASWVEDIARARGSETVGYPTAIWSETGFVADSQMVKLLPGTPAGTYTLSSTLFDRNTLQPLSAPRTPEGFMLSTPLQRIRVQWSSAHPELEIPQRLDYEFEQATLLGYSLDRATAIPGEVFLLTLFWENSSGKALPVEQSLNIKLSNTLLYEAQAFQTDQIIPAGMRWREQYTLRIPAATKAGDHSITIQLAANATPLTEALTITPIERNYELPDCAQHVQAHFEDTIHLEAFTLKPDNDSTSITLYWSVDSEITANYKIFVHALNLNEELVAQSDSIPGQGQRPFTSWLPKEYIIDSHVLQVPIQQVSSLRVGLYDSETGVRARLAEGVTFIELDSN